MKRPSTLLSRIGLTIAVAMLIFILFASGVLLSYIFLPMARPASTDLATLILFSATTWARVLPAPRPGFVEAHAFS